MNKKYLLFVLILLLSIPFNGVAQDKKPMSVEDVLGLKDPGSVTISPDGKWIAFVLSKRDFEKNKNNSDIWVVSTKDKEAVQLTFHKGKDNGPQWSADSKWLTFLSDRTDKTQVFGIKPDGGESWQISNWDQGISRFRISPNGQKLAFSSRAKQTEEQEKFEKKRGRPQVWDDYYDDQWTRLWVAEIIDSEARDAVQFSSENHQVAGFEWSPNSRKLAYAARPEVARRSFRKGAIFLVEEAGKPNKIADIPGGEGIVDWSEEQGLLISGSGKELGTFNSHLWRVPLDGGQPIELTSDLDENAGFVSATASALFIESTHRTIKRLYKLPMRKGVVNGKLQLISDDNMYYRGFSMSKNGNSIAFIGETKKKPADIFYTNVNQFTPVQLTNLNPQTDQFVLGDQQVFSWKSRADGEPIEGVLSLPVGYKRGDRVPLLLVIHGGPSGVSSNRFLGRRGAYPIQVFAGMGYAILQPNYRGSTGYGERFRGLNRGDISGKDWIDIDSGVDALIEEGIADPNQLGIMGWSFGGHHTFWGITQTNRYKAASAGAGANDLISMYSQTDIPEFYHTYLGPKPWEDFELYEERSAYRYVDKVTTPLLIQVGEKDERVPAEQSIQFYEAVKAIGKAPTQLVLYPGQPHGVREPRLVRDLLLRNVEWFEKYIPTSKP